MQKRSLSLAALFVATLCLIPENLSAQVLYGSLTGNITDPTGAAVATVKVEALNVGTGVSKSASTDERGIYLFSDLQPGTYKVTIAASGFATRVQEGVIVTANNILRLDAELKLSQISESVTVDAAAVTLQTDRADINNVIRSSQITDLPLINSQGRNFQIGRAHV